MDHAKTVDALALDSEDRSIEPVDQMAVRDAQLSRLRAEALTSGRVIAAHRREIAAPTMPG